VAILGILLLMLVLPSLHPSATWVDVLPVEDLEKRALSILSENGYEGENLKAYAQRRVKEHSEGTRQLNT